MKYACSTMVKRHDTHYCKPTYCKPAHYRHGRVSAKKILGLAALSAGVGMLAAIMIPAWGILFAAMMTIFGFWCLFIS
ncbi:hypothetical protein FACS189490_13770 [Clostridia bacterium]|nr:hypothetical protein FACS189490_13770 [Clostridia bacterium]